MFTTRTSKQAIALNKTVFRLYSTQKFSNLSQAQVQRFVNLFRAYDADQDGKLTEEDYNRLCSRFLKLAEIDKDSDDAVHLKTTFLTRWDYVKQEIDPEDKGLITCDKFVEWHNRYIAQNPKASWDSVPPIMQRLYLLMFDAIDSNNSGGLSVEAYRILAETYNPQMSNEGLLNIWKHYFGLTVHEPLLRDKFKQLITRYIFDKEQFDLFPEVQYPENKKKC